MTFDVIWTGLRLIYLPLSINEVIRDDWRNSVSVFNLHEMRKNYYAIFFLPLRKCEGEKIAKGIKVAKGIECHRMSSHEYKNRLQLPIPI